ncbi:MAG TPA: hypothetical protein VN847_19940 [Streptosporangiaceae bacterium]|nr:hypothetical protein [Streptosporangiaceae bacterium]
MNIRALFAGVGAAAVVASGTLALTSTVASAQSKPQTLTYYTATLKSVAYSSTRSAVTESVDNSSGKLVGFEVETVSRAINAPITTSADVIYLESGVINATVNSSRVAGHGSGKVTGGTGSYSKAAGTVTLAPDGARTKVTIVLTRK